MHFVLLRAASAAFCQTALLAVVLGACQVTPAPRTGCSEAKEPATAAAAATHPETPRKFVVENSELMALHSEQTGRDYEVIVGVPSSYAKDPERRYPVLYLLDGQWDFTLVNALVGGLLYDKVVPEFLVVGVSYGGEKPDYGKLRGEDYAPTRAHGRHQSQPSGGDAPKFLRFLEENVLPTVEQHYRVDTSQRILSGSSLGGLFTLYALFEKPDLFQSYLALSPAVGWDDRYLFRREQEFHARHPQLEKRIWLSVGAEEWPDYVQNDQDFFAQFEASHYQGATLKVHVVPGERHAGVKPEAYNRALRFVFESWAAAQPRD